MHRSNLALFAALPLLLSAATTASADEPPKGKLKRTEFEEALKPYLVKLRECYDKALKKDAIAEGSVVLVLSVQNGKVVKAETDRAVSTMKLDDAHKCIIAIAKTMKMPDVHGADGKPDTKAIAEVRYPLEFSLGIDVAGSGVGITGANVDRDKVKHTFFMERLSIGACYLDAYKAKKGTAAAGKQVLKITVKGGKVTAVEEVEASTTVNDTTLRKCVLEAVKKFKFPVGTDAKGAEDPAAESVITYPLEFKAA